MYLAVKCIAALSILASPCAWDSDPREASAIAAIQGEGQFVGSLSAPTPDYFQATADTETELFHDDDGFEAAF